MRKRQEQEQEDYDACGGDDNAAVVDGDNDDAKYDDGDEVYYEHDDDIDVAIDEDEDYDSEGHATSSNMNISTRPSAACIPILLSFT